MWSDWQNRLHEAKREMETREQFDQENYIDSWERQDDRYHDGKKD